jgi:hypothetical protein
VVLWLFAGIMFPSGLISGACLFVSLIEKNVRSQKSLRGAAAIASLLLVVQFFVPAYSADDEGESWADMIKSLFSSAGDGVEKAAEKTEEGVSTGLDHAEKGIAKGAEETEKGLNKAAEATGNFFKKAGDAIGGADED